MYNEWGFLTVSTVLTFVILLVLVRWIGASQLTQLTFFNWVAGASMGNIAANMMAATNVHDWLAYGYQLVVFALASICAALFALQSRRFRRIANGEPVVLIYRGVILRHNLRRTRLNLDVLLMLLREKGYFAYGEIEYAILEPTGNLSILPKQAAQSVSKEDLAFGPDLSPRGQGPYVEIVVDGEVDIANLHSMGYDQAWLEAQLRQLGVASVADVTFLGVNPDGEIVADTHRRKEERSDPPV